MAARKRKKKSLKLVNFTFFCFMVSVICYLVSALFLRSFNNSLSTQCQELETEISTLETQNEAVAVEVNTLNSKDRVSSIAEEDGLSLNQDNIVTITKQGDSGD